MRTGSSELTRIVVAVSILGLGALSIILIVPVAHATVTPLSTWCSGAGLSYDTSTTTCTVSGSVTMSADVEIASGETLLIPSTGYPTLTINSGVTLTIDSGGNFTIANSAALSGGVLSAGTIDNSGTVTIETSGTNGAAGMDSNGTITNRGTITIENTGSESYGIANVHTIDNFGVIKVENSGSSSTGIISSSSSTTVATITNECSGTIDIANTSGTSAGIANYGIINKYGTIAGTITEESTGVINDYSASCSASGTSSTSVTSSVTSTTASSSSISKSSTSTTTTQSTTSQAPSSTTSATTSAASSSSSSSGGIPEFPFQGVIITSVTLAMIASYFMVRRMYRSRTLP